MLALPFIKLLNDVYVVAGPSLTHLYDAYAYSIVRSGTALLIDAGSGFAAEEMFRNIGDIGVKLQTVKYLVITHGHYDHIGGARKVKEKTNCKVIMHKFDADILEEGKTVLSAADFYGESLEPCEVDLKLETKDREVLKLEDIVLEAFHIPGHTPGSIALYYESIQRQKVLFGGGLHGPFSSKWRSNIEQWKKSLKRLLELDISILCEGHNIVEENPHKWMKKLFKNIIQV